MLDKIIAKTKQWLLYPEEFQITIPKSLALPEYSEEKRIKFESRAASRLTVSENEETLLSMAVDVGTLVWRIQRKLSDMSELPANLRRVSRDLEATWNALSQSGVEIKDHNNQEYHPGMALKIITSQPVANLKRQQIIETLKPTIYYKDKILQMGEVVVGVPENPGSSETTEDISPHER